MLFVALRVVKCERELGILLERHGGGEGTESDFRSLCVEQERDVLSHLFSDLFYHVRDSLVTLVRAVREVESRDVHARVYHVADLFRSRRRGTDRTYDLCFLNAWQYRHIFYYLSGANEAAIMVADTRLG